MPAPPLSVLFAVLPMSTLSSVLPVPLMAAAPVRVRFSMFEARAQVSDACTVSVPAPAASMVTSAASSTT